MSDQHLQSNMDVDPFHQLEYQLQRTLNPVRPDPKFVYHLRHRLVTPAEIVLEPRPGGVAILLVALGLFVGVVITWLLYRLRG